MLAVQERIQQMQEEEFEKKANMQILTAFYLTPYNLTEDFYSQFYGRLQETENHLL